MDFISSIHECLAKSDKIIELIKKNAFGNDESKKLVKLFSGTQAAKMVGVTRESIRLAEKAGKVSQPSLKKGTKKYYSLSEINTLRDFFNTRPKRREGTGAKSLLIMNFKGGVRKTTIALHQAQYLALRGYKVLFIDTDSQASGTTMFGYTPDLDISTQETIIPFFHGESSDLGYCIKRTYFDGLDLIPSYLNLYDLDFFIINKVKQDGNLNFFKKLREGIDTIRNNYDFIIIDAPPSLGAMSINLLYAADAIVIPVPPVIQDFCSTRQFFDLLISLQQYIPAKGYDFIKLLISKHDGKKETEAFVRLLNSTFPSEIMMRNHFKDTSEVVRASAHLQSVYELNDVKGRETYNRALGIINNVCGEIEELLLSSYSGIVNKSARREVEIW